MKLVWFEIDKKTMLSLLVGRYGHVRLENEATIAFAKMEGIVLGSFWNWWNRTNGFFFEKLLKNGTSTYYNNWSQWRSNFFSTKNKQTNKRRRNNSLQLWIAFEFDPNNYQKESKWLFSAEQHSFIRKLFPSIGSSFKMRSARVS